MILPENETGYYTPNILLPDPVQAPTHQTLYKNLTPNILLPGPVQEPNQTKYSYQRPYENLTPRKKLKSYIVQFSFF